MNEAVCRVVSILQRTLEPPGTQKGRIANLGNAALDSLLKHP